MPEPVRVIPFERVRMRDLAQVGGKNASLGEMIGELASAGIRVPGGFATTADAFREFLQHDGLAARIEGAVSSLDVADVGACAAPAKRSAAGSRTRRCHPVSPATIEQSYQALVDGADSASFAVRSSATAEDLPDASFAGQQDTFLNISGLENILHAVSEVFASIYNDRAIAYRAHHGFAHDDVALSVGVQRMVRSDAGAAGRDVHARYRVGLRGRRAHHVGVRTRRIGRAGIGQSGRVLRVQAEPRRGEARDPAQDARQQGHADDLRRERRAPANRRASSTFRKTSGDASRSPTRKPRSSRATQSRSSATTAVRWTSNGVSTATTASSTSCRRARKR